MTLLQKLTALTALLTIFHVTSAFSMTKSLEEQFKAYEKTANQVTADVDELVGNLEDLNNGGVLGIQFTQKDADKFTKKSKNTIKKGAKLKNKIRKRLTKIRQDPDFDANVEEIEQLEYYLQLIDFQKDGLKELIGELKQAKSDLPLGIKSIDSLVDQALTSGSFAEAYHFDVVDLKAASDAGTLQITETVQALIEDVDRECVNAKKLKRKLRKKLSSLFGDLKKTAAIRALQGALRYLNQGIKLLEADKKVLANLTEAEGIPRFTRAESSLTNGTVCSFIGIVDHSTNPPLASASMNCLLPDPISNAYISMFSLRSDTGEVTELKSLSISYVNGNRAPNIQACADPTAPCIEAYQALEQFYQGGVVTIVIRLNGPESPIFVSDSLELGDVVETSN